MKKTTVIYGISPLTDFDIYLFKEGRHTSLYDKLGAHIADVDGIRGVHFAVWAPDAISVSVIGDFNGWDGNSHPLKVRDDWSGIWEGFIPGVVKGSVYKYQITSRYRGYTVKKGDPFAFFWEEPPRTASVVWNPDYKWSDGEWLRARRGQNSLNAPISIYEVHLGSWMRAPEEGNRPLTYREMAHKLAAYAVDMGFTHVELLPVMEHPFYGSWGYQTTGYFAPTARYGAPEDFMYFIDIMHQNNIAVILDWVPSHFPADEHGLSFFDGTHLYEHADPRKGFHPDWGSSIFNYERSEVRSFLFSAAFFWIDNYHADGIRVDAVASMLYLDYSRKSGEWIPNRYGGRENLDAIDLMKSLNEAVYRRFPDVQMIAEESTDWPMVSRPTYLGGLGFGMKWNMGWMNDTLEYFKNDPVFRKYCHQTLIFSIWYAFTENFLLPLSHDEVVHGKGSLLGKMPGDEWQRFSNLRLLYGYMFTHPGKKLLFMGGEFGQVKEWNHEESLEWHVLEYPLHSGLKQWVKDLNRHYRSNESLWTRDFESAGFEWIDCNNFEESVVSYLRKGENEGACTIVICNFTPVLRLNYLVGAPSGGLWKEALNSDALEYGGSGRGNMGGVRAYEAPSHGRPYSLSITLPPLSTVIFWKKG
ncbi:MAG: 1,4-alpha-glucan branching protein GlgB [Deltaproteobacteria bacterium]|nr:1,4-alpha-glucan branching protein GlgB [Deltaproteobacteria bacterium]